MADDSSGSGEPTAATETEALNGALAAEHTAVWGYGVVDAELPAGQRGLAADAEAAHRDARDRLMALISERDAEPVDPAGGYELPFPILSETDAATLAVTLEDGVAAAYVRVLGDAAESAARQVAVDALSATEVRAVGWRTRAKQKPLTNPFPGLPEG
jgi:hypothetical protein